ncbi:MAG TPA: response regulator [Candidatus Polarisedimenticolia bacterium]|nr:response regulator [Candidatus Polarisedimenticolia bacterium]
MPTKKSVVLTPRRALVVDDDQTVLDLVDLILTGEGFIVDTVTTSQAALSKARETEYDLAILDLILPDMDGVILQSKLKRLAPDLGERTIFMTGFTSKDVVLEYLRSLSGQFIHKPFHPDQLVRAVKKLA